MFNEMLAMSSGGGKSYTYNEIRLAAGVGTSASFKIQNGTITIVPYAYESANFQNYYAFENGQIVSNYQNPNGRFTALYDGEKITITNQTSGYTGRIFVYGDWSYLT